MKKIMILILSLSLFAAYGSPSIYKTQAATSPTLSDISNHWSADSVRAAVTKGYVNGYEDGTFRPDREVSRAEFIKLASSALKLSISSNGDYWYSGYVKAAVEAGIHKYEDFDSGDMNTPITREEMARIIIRAADPEQQKETDNKKLVYEAVKKGLIQGLTGGQLGLDQATTRAQSVTVIERILTVIAGGTLPVDKYALNRAEVYWHKTNIFTVLPQFFGTLHPSSKWDPNNLFYETPDGDYRGEVDALIAIDLEDPNDPHLDLIPELEEMEIVNYLALKYMPVKAHLKSYLIYYPGRQVVNKDTEVYTVKKYQPLTFVGFESIDREAAKKGSFNFISGVRIDEEGDFPGYLLPKKAKTRGNLMIDLYAPAIGGTHYADKRLLWSLTPTMIE
jgi:hypothetical protein